MKKQRVPLKQALRVHSRLVEAYGVRLEAGGRAFHGHPRPEALLEAGVEELRRLGSRG